MFFCFLNVFFLPKLWIISWWQFTLSQEKFTALPFCDQLSNYKIMENLRISLSTFLIVLASISLVACSSCDRERCCSIDPCTSLYCQQKNSETWISTENYENYQFTKLVMYEDECKPCPNNCQTCTSPTVCEECYSGYFLSDEGICEQCDYKCLACTEVNDIKKCSECDTGTYLDDTTLTCKSCPMGAESCSS